MTSPVHILYIAEFSTGGSVESLLCLVGGLDKSQFRATVLFYSLPDDGTCDRFQSAGATICSLYPRRTGRTTPQDLRKLNLQTRIREILGARVERLYESCKFALYFARFRRPVYRAICKKIRSISPDLVHLNNGVDTDTPGILAARKCNVPAVCHLRTLGRLTYLHVAASRSVHKFICISNAVRDTAVTQGVNRERCIVIPNAVELARFDRANKPTSDIRKEFGWNSSHRVFSIAGRLVSWKGQDYFIRALAEAYETDQSIRALIVGDGDDSDSNDAYIAGLRSLVSELGLDDIVRFTGHRNDIPDIMKASDAVVCASSLPEPFGRVIIEGMATGAAVIATDAGGAPDVIENDVNGLLVPIRDSHSMAAAMLRLCTDAELTERLRLAAQVCVYDLYTVGRHVDAVCGVYRSALASN